MTDPATVPIWIDCPFRSQVPEYITIHRNKRVVIFSMTGPDSSRYVEMANLNKPVPEHVIKAMIRNLELR